MCDVSLKTVQHEIQHSNLCLMPGGIAELLLSSREEEVLYLRKRHGFLSVAHASNSRVVPCYVFGNTQLFSQVSTSKHFSQAWHSLSRKLRLSLTFFWGQFGLPIPFQTKMVMVIGRPLTTTGDLNRDLETYVMAVKDLFEKYKVFGGFVDKSLTIT